MKLSKSIFATFIIVALSFTGMQFAHAKWVGSINGQDINDGIHDSGDGYGTKVVELAKEYEAKFDEKLPHDMYNDIYNAIRYKSEALDGLESRLHNTPMDAIGRRGHLTDLIASLKKAPGPEVFLDDRYPSEEGVFHLMDGYKKVAGYVKSADSLSVGMRRVKLSSVTLAMDGFEKYFTEGQIEEYKQDARVLAVRNAIKEARDSLADDKTKMSEANKKRLKEVLNSFDDKDFINEVGKDSDKTSAVMDLVGDIKTAADENVGKRSTLSRLFRRADKLDPEVERIAGDAGDIRGGDNTRTNRTSDRPTVRNPVGERHEGPIDEPRTPDHVDEEPFHEE